MAQIHKAYPNAKSVAVALDPKDPYQSFLARNVAPAAFEKNGMSVVNKDALIEIPVDVTDFSVFVTRIKALNPDIILTAVAHEALAGFLKEANRQKLTVPMFGGLGSITDAVAEAAQSIHVFAGQPFDPSSDEPKVVAYVKEFRARSEKQLPGQYANPIYADAGAYEGTYMFADRHEGGRYHRGDARQGGSHQDQGSPHRAQELPGSRQRDRHQQGRRRDQEDHRVRHAGRALEAAVMC